MMKRPGIHFRILVSAFLLISATTLTLGYIGSNIIHQFVRSRFDERIAFLAKYLALNSELGILIDERMILNRLAQNLLSEKDVAGVTILNDIGETLTDVSKEISDGFPKNPDALAVIEVPVVVKESRDESLAFQWNIDEKKQEEEIGRVRITYSTEGISNLLLTMKTRFAWLAAGLSVLCMFIFYFISRSLVSPVTRLARAARQVEKGDLKLRVVPSDLPETKELAIAFNAMLDSLEKSRNALEKAHQEMLRQKTLAEMGKFSLMVAHEVKNPLSIIKSSIDILKKDITELSGHMMVEYIEDEIRRLNRLIEDFLLFARPVVPVFRSVDLNTMLNECVVGFEHVIKNADSEAQIQIHMPSQPCYANADMDLLIRAMGNILKNAFEANEQKGIIRVKATMTKDNWIAAIEDDGNGIEPEHLRKIFEPFFTTRSKGTGLGLAFAFQVISGHSGDITAHNKKQGGAVFQVKLPLG